MVPVARHAHVGVGIGLGAQLQLVVLDQIQHRQVLLGVPAQRRGLTIHQFLFGEHCPRRPRFDHLRQERVLRGVGEYDRRPARLAQRHPLQHRPAQFLRGQVGARVHVGGFGEGDNPGDVGVDHRDVERPAHRDPVVTVPDEVHVADLVDIDRRKRLPGAHRQGQPLPALSATARGGAELRVEVADLVHRPDDLLDRDDLHPERLLADDAEGVDDLLEGQRAGAVLAGTAHLGRDVGQQLLAAHSEEIGLGVGAGRTGVESGHWRPFHSCGRSRRVSRWSSVAWWSGNRSRRRARPGRGRTRSP